MLVLLDQTSQAVQFNRELLESTLDNMSQGVAVVDPNLCLIGWNRRYLDLHFANFARRCQVSKRTLHVAVMDIDDLKGIND